MKPLYLAIALSILSPQFSPADDEPTAEQVMRKVRHANTMQNYEFSGRLETRGAARTNQSFRLRMQRGSIRFEFDGGSPRLVQLELLDGGSRLTEDRGNGVRQVPAERLGDNLRGSALNYEDISMRFIYWPWAKIEKEGSAKGQKCWIVLLRAPGAMERGGPKGPYLWVRVWVEQKSGAMMKMEAFDSANNKVKEFVVLDGQKVDGNMVLEKMSVTSYRPGSKQPSGLSYLHLGKPVRLGGNR